MIDTQKLTIKQASEDLEQKKYTSIELLESCFTKIESYDERYKVFISQLRDSAQKQAISCDEEKDRKSLIAGIPTSLKDLYNLKGSKTTAASNIIKDYVSPYTSTVAQKLLDAGSVILGKTNLDSFAHGSSTETSDFFTTLNPWDKTCLPGGSSGGSAAAVLLGMGLYSIGTETAGSIRQPASWCGLTGLKPTYGRISRYGVISMGSSLDCPGPICKSVEDCSIVLDILAGNDPKDATTLTVKPQNFFKSLSSDINGLKVGLPKSYFDSEVISPEVLTRVNEAIDVIKKLGATIIEIDLMDPKYAIAVYTIVCRSEVSSNLARYDGIRFGHTSSTKAETMLDQIGLNRGEGFGNEAKRRIMTGAYTLSAGYYDAYYKKAQQVRTLIRNDINKAFDKVDVIIGPTTPSTALKVGSTKGNPLFGEIADVLIEAGTLSGCPGISLPVGFDKKGLPVGMNIIAAETNEQIILNMGYAFQNETDWHLKLPNL